MANKEIKVIVAHPFQQHSFETASAIKKSGYLYKYITSVYLKNGSLTSILSTFIKGQNLKRLLGRKTEYLKDEEVILFVEWANLILLLLQRIDKTHKVYNFWYWKTVKIFNIKLYNYVKKNDIDVVIVYDTVSSDFICKAKKNNLSAKIIVDMSAPNTKFMKQIFKQEAKLSIKSHKDLEKCLKEMETKYFYKKCKASDIEIKWADAFLVASEFTKKSLRYANVTENKIFKCVYGVNRYQKDSSITYKSDVKIVCSYSGKVCFQKGAYRLLNVIDTLDLSKFEFNFYGFVDKESEYYKKFKNKCIFHGHIPHAEMIEQFKKSDIIIFPSFADGFGLSVTEALLENNIAICSSNAGVSEYIKDNLNGFVYDPADEKKLRLILKSITKLRLKEMQNKTCESLIDLTWENYEKQIINAINKTLNIP